MEEGEHSELDSLLKEQLSDPKVRQDLGSPSFARRAGSTKIHRPRALAGGQHAPVKGGAGEEITQLEHGTKSVFLRP